MLPIVAIVGRPNVGKSSLLNFLAGRRISIVDPTAGVTRDRVATPVEFEGKTFELTDTGGYGIIDKDNLTADIERQIQIAIDEAQLILFVVDVKEGYTPLDRTVAEYLRKQNKPVLVVANKTDSGGESKLAVQAAELYSMGYGEPIMVSCTTRKGKSKLLEQVLQRLDYQAMAAQESPELKIAVVGKRNAGKSTLINTLAGQPRVIVSEVPGTTRDSVDVRFEREGHTYMVIDTAGIRKKAKITRDDLEFYAFHRAQRSIRRADVVFLLIDATAEMGDVDQKIAAYVAAENKPCVIVINKWDLAKNKAEAEKYEDYVGKVLPLLDYAPIAFISARENENIDQLVQLAQVMFQQSSTRLGTAELNKAVEDILAQRGPSSPTLQKVKVYYATQIDVKPPTIVLFVNNPDLITEEYRRYFVRQLRERLAFSEVPIKLFVRGHHRSFEKADRGKGGGKPKRTAKTSATRKPVARPRGKKR
ncbi:MAG TPA: ribosome biogenesis GTPase Der [Phycisphaerae bacterium]|nr:ribosome biogenesis GTPase Der [Phycisphaerae bacterium]